MCPQPAATAPQHGGLSRASDRYHRYVASANVELARRLVDAFNARDRVAFVGLVSDDLEWVTPTASSAEPKTYHGLDGVGEFFEEAQLWDVIEARIDEIRDLGEEALVLGELRWRSRHGSLEVAGPLCSLLRFEEGKVKRIETYRNASDGLAAAGFEE